jgi:hypothetical protein
VQRANEEAELAAALERAAGAKRKQQEKEEKALEAKKKHWAEREHEARLLSFRQNTAAAKIQSVWRGAHKRRVYRRAIGAALTIQRYARSTQLCAVSCLLSVTYV